MHLNPATSSDSVLSADETIAAVRNITSAWRATLTRMPGKTALICGENSLNHLELAKQVMVLARALNTAGVKPGDRVVVFLENSIEFAASMLAILELQAVFVPISPQTRSDKLVFILEDTQASALVSQVSLTRVWSVAAEQPGLQQTLMMLLADQLLVEPSVVTEEGDSDDAFAPFSAVCADDDLAAIIYTSGTTGYSKGVMLSHGNIYASRHNVQSYLELRSDDVIGLALPLAFSYGLYHLIMGLWLGATIVIERNVVFPVVMLKSWEQHRVTVFPGVPTLFASLLTQDLSAYELQSLRLITNAGSALSEKTATRVRQAFPQTRLFLMYGLTECKRASYLSPTDLDARANSVGKGLPAQRHWLIDNEGREVVQGQTGQLVVAGPHVMKGYWRRPAETAQVLRPAPDGTPALYTGDLFYSDADGYLYFIARSDDIIKSRGEKVSPLEVERAICELPEVLDAVVTGVADDILGMAVRAYIKLSPGALLVERAVIRHCLARLDSVMVPKSVIFVEEFPMADSGKIRRASLK
ncbi:class I adenylate-forming enzyme family protein [Granulosicoccus antarcticus]|uniref:Long-chain-fatty-acid--CoA ligase n=1 Tax=Granulosicoccus antarcticus IMCC3135 TaxID=1192854 RepID=A0A2Z2NU14_9GAMM|nr:class I adenylate-forming enzyme family protein [Granulosicoccus antarcticus]ASJ74799.1 Long-chain-fatty-acid--CoA ligase [Granulosicoccus antarcticus IMCC3135]